MGLFSRFTEGLTKSRESFREDINLLLNRGPKVDEEFWEGLEETLILSDMGGYSAVSIVDKLRNESVRKGYRDAYDVLDALNETIANEFVEGGDEILGSDAIVLFVGVNGSGKTTTCGKIAKQAKDAGRTVILGSGDTFRAAAIEQLEVWAKRADVEIVSRERGSDPASVCYETIERGEQIGADLVLIDTAGRPRAREGSLGCTQARQPSSKTRAGHRCDNRPEWSSASEGVQFGTRPRRRHHHKARWNSQGWHCRRRCALSEPSHCQTWRR